MSDAGGLLEFGIGVSAYRLLHRNRLEVLRHLLDSVTIKPSYVHFHSSASDYEVTKGVQYEIRDRGDNKTWLTNQ